MEAATATAAAPAPPLTPDEIDDLLYFTRANHAHDLHHAVGELAQKHGCRPRDVLSAAIDADGGNTVLHLCAANGFAELLPSLLAQLGGGAEAGAPPSPLVNQGNREGNTPLHWAAYNGHLAVVKLLVAAGADVWAKNRARHLAVFEAERADRGEVVQYLLEAGGTDGDRGGARGQASAVAEEEEEEEEDVADVRAGGADGGAHAGADGDDVDMAGPNAAT